jgi:hypothetical protein
MSNTEMNAKPCFLHGHVWRYYSDGSHDCLSCGLYHGPDTKMVNEMLRAASGRRAYANQALILARLRDAPIEWKAPSAPLLISDQHTTQSGGILLWTVGALLGAMAAILTGVGLAALYCLLTEGHL